MSLYLDITKRLTDINTYAKLSHMTDNNSLIAQLQSLGLTEDEATVYLHLLDNQSTHLRLSRETGITRSKVYHLVDMLEQRGLITHHVDDTGRYIVANRPENLQIQLTAEEERVKARQSTLQTLLPALERLRSSHSNRNFSLHTYEGSDGFRQMLWHELKTEGDLLLLGGGTVEELSPNPRWAARYREKIMAAGYQLRELMNAAVPENFTHLQTFSKSYTKRFIDPTILRLDNQITIYNNTVSTYHWRDGQKIGVEIINKEHAIMMRQIFELYWQLGSTGEPSPDSQA
jgi:predicted transcriptional regulator